MAGRKLRSGRFDADTTSFLIVVAVIAMELLFISALTGAETAYFALLPIVFAVSYLVVFVQITGDVAARQAGMRLKRSRYTDAMEFLRAGSIFAFAAGIVLSIFCSILGSFTAEKIIGSHEAALVLYALIPTLVFGGQLGNLKGFLECSGLTFVTRLGMYILAGSSVLFSILFGIRGSHYGDKVGALLRYDGYRGVYAAAGLVAGISVITEERLIGVRRYAQSDLTSAFANTVISLLDVVPVFFMIGIGIFLQIRKKNPNMFLSGFFMTTILS